VTYRYVHTTSNVLERGWNKQILRPYVKRYLYSLYNGFSNTEFGYDSLDKLSKKIEKYYNGLYPEDGEKLIIDSGGFSIIQGQINPRDITKFMECYCYFMEHHQDVYDYIMSLDIPIFLKYPTFNNVKTIKSNNFKSCIKTKEILEKQPELYEKFIFVWHFKLKKQFDIWREMYGELFAEDKKVKHHAIGGLVSLRGITGIKFSPFIAPVYRLIKLVEQDQADDNSIIHILGVYGKHDRFCLQFMDILINKYYLKDSKKSIDITFDTINYTISGLFKIRDFPLVQLFRDQFGAKTDKDIERLLHVYIPNPNICESIIKEYYNLKNGKQITDTIVLSTTYIIFSHIIDQLMLKFIEDENLVELFIKYPNYNQLKNKLLPILDKGRKRYPVVFKNMETQIMSNFYWLSNFHIAYTDGASLERIDKGIEVFIKHINFPMDLDD